MRLETAWDYYPISLVTTLLQLSWGPNYYSTLAMCCARYLGLGMRYDAGICTIVISMNGAFR